MSAKEPQAKPVGSVQAKTFLGAAWMMAGGWLQLGLSLVSFFVITSRLQPSDVGVFGVAALVVGVVQALIGGLFIDSLQQRAELTKAQTNATFWIGLAVAAVATVGLVAAADPIASRLGAPQGGTVLRVLAVGILTSTLASIPGALLIRDLQFDKAVQARSLAALAGSCAGLVCIFSGLGVWSLVVADLASKIVSLGALYRARPYRPSRPQDLGAIGPLMRFNLGALGAYLIGHADRTAPRALTGALLGPQALGYLIMAERVLELLHQLVLSPLSAVTMSAVARLQSDQEGVQDLIGRLYGLSTTVGYPAFIGAALLAPSAFALIGPHWAPAALTAQILLLVGLRTSTGVFNIAILRGLGRTLAPLLLLSLGLALQLILTPVGSRFGPEGVAGAMLARHLATWPLGCLLIAQATGLSVRRQAALGAPAFAAACVMAAAVWPALQALAHAPVFLRAGVAAIVGPASYLAALLLISSSQRDRFDRLVRGVAQGGLRGGLKGLRAEFRPGVRA